MGYSFEAKDIEEAIKISSGNYKFLEKECEVTDKVRGFLESFKKGFYPDYSQSKYGKELNNLIDQFFQLDRKNCNLEELLKALKKIYEMFKKFHIKVLIISNEGRLENRNFLKAFIDNNNEDDLLVLQPFGKIDKEIFSLNALKNYSDLFINGFNKEGIYIYTREKGVFIPTENLSKDEIINTYNKYFSKEFFFSIKKLDATKKRISIEKKLDEIKQQRNQNLNEITLIHISDLHLGNVNPKKKKKLLELINEIKGEKNYCLITGDLTNTPNTRNINNFLNFEKKLRLTLGNKNLFYVRGNHDDKVKGLFYSYKDEKEIIKNLVSRDEIVKVIEDEILLIRIDSNIDSPDLARGKIGKKQMDFLEKEIKLKDPNNTKLKLAILHHHPIKMSRDEGIIRKYCNSFLKEKFEKTLLLKDAKIFLNWCDKNKIKCVLNGHEHVEGHKIYKNTNIIASASSLGVAHLGESEEEFVFCNILKYNKKNKLIETVTHYYEGKRNNNNKDNMTIKTIALI